MFRTKDTYGKHRYAGRSKAQVLDNRDPANKGRIQVKHPILGETVWIDYLRQPNQFDVPSIGDVVYVECDTGEHEFPIAHGNLTLGYPGKAVLPDAFKRNVPSNRGFFTPGGHLIEMDDGESKPTKSPNDKDLTTKNRGIRITSKDGYKIHIMEDPDNGKQQILIEAKDGSFMKLDVDNNSMDIHSVGKYNVDAGGDAKIVTPTKVTVDTPATEVTGTLKVGGNATLDANLQVTGTSQLGGGVPLLLSTAQMVGTGNLGAPVISTIMSGQATKALGS